MTITKSETLICCKYFCSAINSSPLIAPLCYLKKCSLLENTLEWQRRSVVENTSAEVFLDSITTTAGRLPYFRSNCTLSLYCIASNCILMSFDRCAFYPIVFCHSDVGNVSKASTSCSPGVLHQIDVLDLQSNYKVHPANNKNISKITTDSGAA